MKNAIWLKALILLFLSSPSFASSLDHASHEQLLEAKEILEARQRMLDPIKWEGIKKRIIYGLSPDTNNALQLVRFFQEMDTEKIDLKSLGPKCQNYFTAHQLLKEELNKNFRRFLSMSSQKTRLLLQARIESLELIFADLTTYGLSDAEGGITPFSQRKTSCPIARRQDWKAELIKEQQMLEQIQLSLFGTFGVANVYSLATWLSDQMVQDAEHEFKWFAPKIVGEVAATIFVWELAEATLPSLAATVFGVGRTARYAVTAAKYTPLAAIGAYQGYKLADLYEQKGLITEEGLESSIKSAMAYVKLPLKSLEEYFAIISPSSEAMAKVLKGQLEELKNVDQIAIQKWGSLTEAQLATQRKLDEVHAALSTR